MIKTKDEYDWTTNRSVYNRTRKRILDNNREIHCDRCVYHRGDNDIRKNYSPDGRKPSWKLATKNRRQWMPKKLHIVCYHSIWTEESFHYVYFI